MKKRLIEKNGDHISQLGFGAMRLPINKDYEKSKELVRKGIDNGINYIDTAFLYGLGKNERFIADVLKDGYRNKVKIATKLPGYTVKKEEDLYNYLDKQLKLLDVDCIDYYYLHSVDLKIIRRLEKRNVFEFLDRAKSEGKIKNACFSYHGKSSEFNEIIDKYEWDACLVQFNYFDENMQVNYDNIKYAKSKGMGIFIMEPLKGGLLAKLPEDCEEILKNTDSDKTPAQWSFSWLYNMPEITCVLSGMENMKDLESNIKIANQAEPNSLKKEELEAIDNVKKLMKNRLPINCSTCGYCMPCKYGVNIPEAFQKLNDKYLFNENGIKSLIEYMVMLGGIHNEASNAGLCTHCNKCIPSCTQNLNIPEELNKVKKEYEKPGFKQLVWISKKILYPVFSKYVAFKSRN